MVAAEVAAEMARARGDAHLEKLEMDLARKKKIFVKEKNEAEKAEAVHMRETREVEEAERKKAVAKGEMKRAAEAYGREQAEANNAVIYAEVAAQKAAFAKEMAAMATDEASEARQHAAMLSVLEGPRLSLNSWQMLFHARCDEDRKFRKSKFMDELERLGFLPPEDADIFFEDLSSETRVEVFRSWREYDIQRGDEPEEAYPTPPRTAASNRYDHLPPSTAAASRRLDSGLRSRGGLMSKSPWERGPNPNPGPIPTLTLL